MFVINQRAIENVYFAPLENYQYLVAIESFALFGQRFILPVAVRRCHRFAEDQTRSFRGDEPAVLFSAEHFERLLFTALPWTATATSTHSR